MWLWNLATLIRAFSRFLEPFFRSGILALQQFQLAVQGCQESRSSNKLFIRGCQKLRQSQVNTQRIDLRLSIWYRHVRLNCDTTSNHLFAFLNTRACLTTNPSGIGRCKLIGIFPSLGKLDLPSRNGIGFELRKQHGLHLSKLLEAGKAKPPLLKIIPSVMQSPNSSLQNLRRGFTQLRKLFLRLGKCVLLNVIGGKWLVCWNDVFSLQRTIVQTTFTRIHPILDFSQSVVIDLAGNFQPMQALFALGWRRDKFGSSSS